MSKKYLIYVETLGYKGKAEEIAEITGIDEDICKIICSPHLPACCCELKK